MLEKVKRFFLQEKSAKTEALYRANSFKERLKALEEENASLKLNMDRERSTKDRLLAVVRSLTGSFSFPLTNLIPVPGTCVACTESTALHTKQDPRRFPKLRE